MGKQSNASLDTQLIGGAKNTRCYGCKGETWKLETESETIAAQDQALQTKYHATTILQTETDSKCQQFDESCFMR